MYMFDSLLDSRVLDALTEAYEYSDDYDSYDARDVAGFALQQAMR